MEFAGFILTSISSASSLSNLEMLLMKNLPDFAHALQEAHADG